MTKIAMFTGSFDPITNGHMDIIARASKLFDELYIGLFYNKNKQGFWDVETRKRILECRQRSWGDLFGSRPS